MRLLNVDLVLPLVHWLDPISSNICCVSSGCESFIDQSCLMSTQVFIYGTSLVSSNWDLRLVYTNPLDKSGHECFTKYKSIPTPLLYNFCSLSVIGVVKVGRYFIFHRNFFFKYYALAKNFWLSQPKQPNFDYPQMHKIS